MARPKTNKTRFFTYILGKFVALFLALLLIYNVGLAAMQSSNVYMLCRDAFEKRTSVILKPLDNTDTPLLSGLFTKEYLKKSKLHTQTTNASYAIENFNQRTDVSFKAVMPWQNTVKVKVKNTVNEIVAKVSEEAVEGNFNEVDSFIESGEYIVTLVKDKNGWQVSDIELEKEIKPDNVLPIPTPSNKAETPDEAAEVEKED